MRTFVIALSALLLGLPGPALADIYVIVHAGNPVRTMNHKDVTELYMGRSRTFTNNDFALPFDLPKNSPTRDTFYRALTGMEPAQVNSYWSRLMFSGQTLPPHPIPTEAALLDLIKRNPSAIGYLSQEPSDKGVKVVLVLKQSN